MCAMMSLSERLKNPNFFYLLSYTITARVEDKVKYSSLITRFIVKQVLMFPVYVGLFILAVSHEVIISYTKLLDKIADKMFKNNAEKR